MALFLKDSALDKRVDHCFQSCTNDARINPLKILQKERGYGGCCGPYWHNFPHSPSCISMPIPNSINIILNVTPTFHRVQKLDQVCWKLKA